MPRCRRSALRCARAMPDQARFTSAGATAKADEAPARTSVGALPPVVFALAYQTWADAVGRDMSWSADQMVQRLLDDVEVPSVLVADPLRSHLARLRTHAVGPQQDFPTDPTRTLLQPRRWRRLDAEGFSTVRAYRRLDDLLGRRASEAHVLVTCHPVHAAVADRSRWRDVVYYAWDDWLEYPPLAGARDLHSWSYRQMAERDVNVIGVSQAVVDNIGQRGRAWSPTASTQASSTVSPNLHRGSLSWGIRLRSTPAPSNVASTLLR